MTYFDSHCHLTDPRFAGEVGLIAERARAAGVQRFVIIASNEDDATAAQRLALELDVWSTAGIHPHEADRWRDGFDRIREVAGDPRVVAIGETGLDYHYDHAPRAVQRQAFERHLDLAAEAGKPVVVHSRDANDDTIAVIRNAPPGVNGVLHCFAGNRALFEAALEADWYVSFSGLLTFPGYDTAVLAAEAPEERLLIETDAPYLAPVPHRGRRNEPAYVVEVARAVAALRDEPLDRIATITTRNANHFYRLD